jgi:hypothetical protein
VQDVLATGLEAGGAIRHHTLTLGGTDLTAEVSLARLAELALAAFGGATIVSGLSRRDRSRKRTKERRRSRRP